MTARTPQSSITYISSGLLLGGTLLLGVFLVLFSVGQVHVPDVRTVVDVFDGCSAVVHDFASILLFFAALVAAYLARAQVIEAANARLASACLEIGHRRDSVEFTAARQALEDLLDAYRLALVAA